MKKLVYISGIVIAILILFGSAFKALHFPGANIMLVLGIVLFSFWFLPSALISSYKSQEVRKYKWLHIATFISFFIVLIGAMFKVMHWHGAGLLLLIGIPVPFVLFLPVYLYQTRKESNKSFFNLMSIMLGLTLLAVFNSLLALNVSRVILDNSSADINKKELLKKYLTTITESYTDKQSVKQKADDLCSQIEIIKCEMLTAAGNEICENNKRNNSEFPAVFSGMDNTDIPTAILFRKNGTGELPALKKNISSFQKEILALNISDDLKTLVSSLLTVSDKVEKEEVLRWEDGIFASYQMVFVIDALTRIENNVRLIEAEVLREI